MIEPEYGYGWLLVGANPEPVETEIPKGFTGVIANALYDSERAYAITAQCETEICGQIFDWVGLIPRTDSIVDLTDREVFCAVILSSTEPCLAQQDLHPELKYLRTESEIYVRGSGKMVLMPTTEAAEQT